jgi:hypothetical protein
MNFVEQINDAIKARMAIVLGSPYKELDYVLDVSSNNFRNSATRYGVRPLESSPSEGVLRSVTLDHTFQIILVDPFVNRDNDLAQREITFTQYAKMDDIYKDLLGSKAGLSNIILLVSSPSTAEPEYLEEENVAILRGNIPIKYRRTIL